jgi:hypothetical protein
MLLSILFSCNSPNRDTIKQIDEISSKLANLESLIQTQEFTTNYLSGRIDDLENVHMFGRETSLDPSQKGYGCISSDDDRYIFLVAWENIIPYADGQKITLRIGNPYYCDFSGFDIHIKYGPREPMLPKAQKQPTKVQSDEWLKAFKSWNKIHDDWKASLKEKTISLSDILKEGSWTTVNIVLAPAKPEEVAYISLGMSTNKILMRKS